MVKRILLTCSSGLLGSYILDFVVSKNFEVKKVGRSLRSDIDIDISRNRLPKIEVDCALHIAGKAHVIPKTI